jgi:hypothetical protein
MGAAGGMPASVATTTAIFCPFTVVRIFSEKHSPGSAAPAAQAVSLLPAFLHFPEISGDGVYRQAGQTVTHRKQWYSKPMKEAW